MIRKLWTRCMYSCVGIAAGGLFIYGLIQAASWLIRREPLSMTNFFGAFVVISAVLTIFLAVCSVVLMRREGFGLRNLMGVSLSGVWLAGNLLCLFLSVRFPTPGFVVKFLLLFGCYADYIMAGMLLMAFLAAIHRPAYDKDFVIIPGCSISKAGGLLPLLKARTNRAIRFAWDQERATGKPARYVPTGGQGPDEIMSEGSAMEFYLLSHGAEQYEVLPEKQSVNTYENMVFSKRMIDAFKADAKVCFVTTNYHVLRSGMLAKKAGLDAEGLASHTKWYFWPNGLARELIAIFSMHPLQELAVTVICVALAWWMTR